MEEVATRKAQSLVDKSGARIDQRIAEMRAQLGREEMSGLWSYYEARSKGVPIATDDQEMLRLQDMYASNPDAFAQEDLWGMRHLFSDQDWDKVTGWRQTALTDNRKAREEGSAIISVADMMKTQLEAVGISATGKDGAEREAAMRREAQFKMALQREVDAWIKEKKTAPLPSEQQAMINKLLLPVVIKEAGTFFDSKSNARLFEVPNLGSIGSNKTAALYADYGEIPQADRISIEVSLEQQLGYKPSEEQVEAEYAAFLQSQVSTGQ
jgi:hypothetical protein